MGRLIVIVLITLLPVLAIAQDEPEYRAEIGAGVGLAAYQGDLSGSITKNMQPMFSLMARYRMNPRSALTMNIGFGKLKGTGTGLKTWYPEYQGRQLDFNNSMVDVMMKYEYNFWPYGTGHEYRGAQRFTPYIYIGIGATIAKPKKTETAVNMPIGAGVKYKIGDRTNVAMEWTIHFTTSDKIDGVADPYGIKSSGLFKNTDGYSHLRLSLTYDIWRKCKTCNNDI